MFVEPLAPFEQSVFHDVYTRRTHTPPINSSTVLTHARLLCSLYEQECKGGLFLQGDPFYAMDLGSNHSDFAEHIFNALASKCGKTGKVLTHSLFMIIARPAQPAPAVNIKENHPWSHQIIEAIFDLDAATLSTPNGQPLQHKPNVLFLSSYCSSSKGTCLMFQGGQWHQLNAQVQLSKEEWEKNQSLFMKESTPSIPISFVWNQTKLQTMLPIEEDQSILHHLSSIYQQGAIFYPFEVFHILRNTASFMTPFGTIIIGDYGYSASESLQEARRVPIHIEKKSIRHPVHFALFSLFAQQENWSALCTSSPIRTTHYAMLRIKQKVSTHVQASFQRNYNDSFDGEDGPVFWDTAQLCMEMGDHQKAAYFAGRCVELNPNDPRFSYLAARAFIAGDQPQAAQYYIELGMKLPHHDDCNFIFQLGRVATILGFPHEAIRYYTQAQEHSLFPALLNNMTHLYLALGQLHLAYQTIKRSVRLYPTHNPSQELLSFVKEQIERHSNQTKNRK